MPEIGDKEKAEAAVQVEMQKIRIEMTEFWKRLRVWNHILLHECHMIITWQGVSASIAQQKYMEMVMSNPAFGYTFFQVEVCNLITVIQISHDLL